MARISREVQLRRAEMVLETFRRMRCRQELSEAVTPFYIFRTDNRQVLARGVVGYDAAKDKANELRKKYGLKWDQVSFCLLYTSPSPRDVEESRMPSSA